MPEIKSQFPIFTNHPQLVYLDNAATTQKPQTVIDSLIDFYSHHNANVHRGLYPLSETATDMYEAARAKIAKFINAEPEEIIFTGSTTTAINAIAQSLVASKLINPEPTIILTELEHHSNLIPWQRIAKTLDYIPLNHYGDLDLYLSTEDHETLANYFELNFPAKQIDVVALTYASNVTGKINQNEIKDIRSMLPGAYLVVDAAQAIGHMPIDVKELDIDFMAFSGHKMYGPTGIGVIYAKKELLEKMEPFNVGGGMIRSVKRDHSTWAPLPEKFEAGTPPIAEAVGLGAAVDFITNIGWDEINKHEQELSDYLETELNKITNLRLYHGIYATGVFSFSIGGIHPHDLSQILGEQNICVRAGHHCTQILHQEVFKVPASTRASLGIYNTKDDINKLISGINNALARLN